MKKVSVFLGVIAFVFAIGASLVSQAVQPLPAGYQFIPATEEDPAICVFQKNCAGGEITCTANVAGIDVSLREHSDPSTSCGELLTQPN
jgi:hypothetical protein